jgi:NAD dependent epimerase/dehydratase family enzyme
LLKSGYKVIIFTTGSTKKSTENHVAYANWNPEKGTIDQEALREISSMVHLAGAGIADKRWTTARKRKLWTAG